MRVRLVTHFAEIGFVGGVNVHVLLSVAAVGEAPVTTLKFTLERFLTWIIKTRKELITSKITSD